MDGRSYTLPERDNIIMRLATDREHLVAALYSAFGKALIPTPWDPGHQLTKKDLLALHPPDPAEVQAWLAKNSEVKLEVAVYSTRGTPVGYLPLQVLWPHETSDFPFRSFDFNLISIEVETEVRTPGAFLALVRRLRHYEDLKCYQRGDVKIATQRFMLYTRPTPFKEQLEQQGIAVYEAR